MLPSEAQLVVQYEPMVKNVVKVFSGALCAPLCHADAMQEGMISLLQAARSWREESGVPFHKYAYICVYRGVRRVVRHHNRTKTFPLTHDRGYLEFGGKLFEMLEHAAATRSFNFKSDKVATFYVNRKKMMEGMTACVEL